MYWVLYVRYLTKRLLIIIDTKNYILTLISNMYVYACPCSPPHTDQEKQANCNKLPGQGIYGLLFKKVPSECGCYSSIVLWLDHILCIYKPWIVPEWPNRRLWLVLVGRRGQYIFRYICFTGYMANAGKVICSPSKSSNPQTPKK